MLPDPGLIKAVSHFGDIVCQSSGVFRRADVADGHGLEFLTTIAVLCYGGIIDGQKGKSAEVKYPHRVRVGFKQHAIVGFTGAQLLLQLFFFTDIDQDPIDVANAPLLVAPQPGPILQPEPMAVVMAQAVLLLEIIGTAIKILLYFGFNPGKVVGMDELIVSEGATTKIFGMVSPLVNIVAYKADRPAGGIFPADTYSGRMAGHPGQVLRLQLFAAQGL